jgi:hypothetical protein
MANHELPRRESSRHVALRALHNMGGDGKIPAWMRVLNWKGKQFFFYRDVVAGLERCGLVETEGGECKVTPAGRIYLGVPVDQAPKEPAIPVGPRYVPPQRPLNLNRHRPAMPTRDGAFDFRSIPSRMANESVPYKGGAARFL